ncbi:hypothetical protein ACFFMN_23175 [Planobispora siamensis]|uniref:Uncharacterized protein n=1 Tax=Planobispora siamensis TaxID=936338 RepID=A0A8J3SL57_9ACTN|nr:hypothetical protein [Planobispora siamensis]GIH95264.1 hypothetical protein Psi01_58940 [Planobispora siamensis]
MTITPGPARQFTDEGFHLWDYTEFGVIPRVLAQSMPPTWQRRMEALLEELNDAYLHLPQPAGYHVRTGTWIDVSDASADQLAAAGVTRSTPYADCDHVGRCPCDEVPYLYTGPDGRQMNDDEEIFIPGPNPLPSPNKGRTHVPPYDGGPYLTPLTTLATFGGDYADGTRVTVAALAFIVYPGPGLARLMLTGPHCDIIGVRTEHAVLPETPLPSLDDTRIGAPVIVEAVVQHDDTGLFLLADSITIQPPEGDAAA